MWVKMVSHHLAIVGCLFSFYVVLIFDCFLMLALDGVELWFQIQMLVVE